MMIKVFTTNKNGKIELTAKELKDLLDEAYWDGFRANTFGSVTYSTPNYRSPYVYTANGSGGTISLDANFIKSGVISTDDVTIKPCADNPDYGK